MASPSLPRAVLAGIGCALLALIAWWVLDTTPLESQAGAPGTDLPATDVVAPDQAETTGGDIEALTSNRGASPAGELNAPTRERHARVLTLRVVRATDCTPIHGAEVFVVSGMGKVLGSAFSDRRGYVPELPHRKRAHGVVAWHPDFQLKGAVLRDAKIELSLAPVAHLELRVAQDNPIEVEWLSRCELMMQRWIACEGNPVRRRADFCEESVYLHLGLDREGSPTTLSGVRVPVYLRRETHVRLYARCALPNRLRWARGATAERKDTWVRDRDHNRFGKPDHAVRVDRDATTVAVHLHPEPRHAAILHYARRAEDDGELWLSLPGTSGLRTASFAERGGVATFRVFGLRGQTYQPTVLVVRNGEVVRRVLCASVAVRGRTEQTLAPIAGGRLRVRVAGASDATVELKGSQRRVRTKDGVAEFAGMRPGRYELFAFGPGLRSEVVSTKVRNEAVTECSVRMAAAGELAIVVPKGTKVDWISVRGTGDAKARGTTVYRSKYQGGLRKKQNADGTVSYTAPHGRLLFPYGSYEVIIARHKKHDKVRVELARPRQVVRFD